MSSAKQPQKGLTSFLNVVLKVWEAWEEANAISAGEDARIVSDFLKILGQTSSCRLFGISKEDFEFFVDGNEFTPWKRFCLNHVRGKIAIHVKASVEALEALSQFGHVPLEAVDQVRHRVDDLQAMVTWMGIYTQNGQRLIELAVKDGRFQHAGEISPIDTELFAACWLVELDSFENNDVKNEAERKIARAIEQNLFGITSPIVKDSATLWWAIKLATRQINESRHPILDQLPGGVDDLLGKCIHVLNLACLQGLNTYEVPEGGTPHPLDYTPEIYRAAKTFSFVLLNVLSIEENLSSSATFRRFPAYWHVLEKLDIIVDKCWEKITSEDFSKLNLYLLSLLNKAMVHWLVQCRTQERWRHFLNVHRIKSSKDNTLLENSTIIEKLDQKPIEGVSTSSPLFKAQVETIREKMAEFLRSSSYKHPFTIAICGPPGSGKTYLAKKLLSSIGVKEIEGKENIPTFNLASHFPNADDQWKTQLGPMVSKGIYNDSEKLHFPFQAVIIDEADSLNPQQTRENATCAYQWLLEPLWEEWPEFEKGVPIPKDPYATFVFVISSRYWTWFKWYHDALRPEVSKGRDFVSRVDESIDLPPMSPEDQLLMAATLLQKANIPKMTIQTASIIALATFENQGRSLETFKKQCKLEKARKLGYLDYKKHMPKTGNFRPEALRMRTIVPVKPR